MKRVLVYFVLVLLVCVAEFSFSQEVDNPIANSVFAGKKEVYFKFNIASRLEILTLTRIISIDNVTSNNVVYAYANKKEFTQFLDLNYQYTLLTNPGDLITNPAMSGVVRSKQIQAAWNAYPTYAAYEAMMYQFATDYPALCKVYNICTLASGRKLLLAKISNNINTHENEPQFLYTSTIHGNEPSGFVHMLHLIDTLLSSYGTNARITNILNNTELWICPLANPDGTFGASGGASITGATRANANGVDMNRNYPDPLQGLHSDGNAWQPETQAFMGFADTMNFVMAANFHEGAEVCNYPWDCKTGGTADESWWELVSHEFADSAHVYGPSGFFTNPYSSGITEGYDWYVVNGGRQDYMNYYHHCREQTIEISGTQCPAASALPGLWNGCRRSFFNYIEQSLKGIRGVVTDSCTGQGIRANVFITGHDVDSTNVYSALPVGNYHRPIYAGTYNLTFSAPGYQSKTINNITVANGSTVVQNVVLRPNPPVASFTADNNNTCSDSITFTDNTGGVTAWHWNFGDGTTSSLQNPIHQYATGGVYTVQLTVSNCAGSDTMIRTNYITVSRPPDPVVNSVSNCGPDSFTLNATGTTNITWWDAASGGNLLDTGATFTTPVLNATTTYYVQANNIPAPVSAAKPDNTGGGGNLSSTTQYLIFDSYVPFTLLSVVIYPSNTGTFTIDLKNSAGTILQTSSNITVAATGQQTVNLNLNVPAGTAMRLELHTGATISLYRNNAGVTYPYTTAGMLSITGSSAGANYYYFFYNWQVQGAGCSSAMVPVIAAINAAPPVAAFTYSANAGAVNFTNTSTNGVTYSWNFGDGDTSNVENPNHNYAANGSYTVQLITVNGCGSDTVSILINIVGVGIDEHSINCSFTVYPNPSAGLFNLLINADKSEKVKVSILDVAGNIVQSAMKNIKAGENVFPIDLVNNSRGLYYLMIQTAAGKKYGKVLVKE